MRLSAKAALLALTSATTTLAISQTTNTGHKGYYKVLRVDIAQWIMAASPNSSWTDETFDITLSGTNRGALPVDCSATWRASTASLGRPPVSTPLQCSDSAVGATLMRYDKLPENGGYVTVKLNNADPATWAFGNVTALPGWTRSEPISLSGYPLVEWKFDSPQIFHGDNITAPAGGGGVGGRRRLGIRS